MTSFSPTSIELASPPDLLDEHLEKSDVAITRHLGLRPTHYSERGPHPDERPCPSWCWIGQSNGEYEHEIDVTQPFVAFHSMEGTANIAAHSYPGYRAAETEPLGDVVALPSSSDFSPEPPHELSTKAAIATAAPLRTCWPARHIASPFPGGSHVTRAAS
jgi:hypothetical protein